MLDVLITEFDTACGFEPLSPSGMAWLDGNTPDGAWWRGNTLYVHKARSYGAIDAMLDAGLEVRARHWKDAP